MARTKREKRMLYALGAMAAVAVGLVLFTLVYANGSTGRAPSPSAASAPPKAAGQASAPEPSETPSPAPLAFRGVDPFKPLVNTRPEGESKAPAPPPPPETPPGPASAVVGGKTVTLIDVFEKNGKKLAHVEVDGTVYSAGAGENFVDDYVLISFDDSCVQFAWRDQSFRLCAQSGGS